MRTIWRGVAKISVVYLDINSIGVDSNCVSVTLPSPKFRVLGQRGRGIKILDSRPFVVKAATELRGQRWDYESSQGLINTINSQPAQMRVVQYSHKVEDQAILISKAYPEEKPSYLLSQIEVFNNLRMFPIPDQNSSWFKVRQFKPLLSWASQLRGDGFLQYCLVSITDSISPVIVHSWGKWNSSTPTRCKITTLATTKKIEILNETDHQNYSAVINLSESGFFEFVE